MKLGFLFHPARIQSLSEQVALSVDLEVMAAILRFHQLI
jgi:hypothetical protein|tara:strand:- start:555 stop:671 length:117 start_codon:yes stop_codon:yes gene_type:complete